MGKTLKKTDLVECVAVESSISKAEAERQIANVLKGVSVLATGMSDGDKLQLVGYLTFIVKAKKESEARNPLTNEKVIVPAHNTIRVKAGSVLTGVIQ